MTLKTINAWKDLPAEDRGASIALGNFDGVHRGHQQVIAQAAKAALAQRTPLGVITFDPHPRRLFRPTEPAFKLMTHAQQARALSGLGVDLLYLLVAQAHFDRTTRLLAASGAAVAPRRRATRNTSPAPHRAAALQGTE